MLIFGESIQFIKMKKIVLSLFFVLSAVCINAQQNANVEEILTSGKWFVESVQEKGQKPEKVENKTDEWMLFHADGKLEENLFGETLICDWKYIKGDNTIKKVEGDIVGYLKIIEISTDKLIVEQTSLDDSENSLMITYVKQS